MRKRKGAQNATPVQTSASKRPNLATEFFAVQAKGISEHWKELVAYEYISSISDKKQLAQLILECIQRLEAAGIKVRALVSDMGCPNVAIWKELGIDWKHVVPPAKAPFPSQYGIANFSVKNYFLNPFDSSRKVYCFPDPTHVLKNIRNQFEKNDFLFPEQCLKLLGEDLTENRASLDHIEKVQVSQQNQLAKFCPKLKPWHIHPSNKEKMRVACSYNVFSAEVHAALLTLVENQSLTSKATTTAAFIKLVCSWYSLMSNRHPYNGIRLISCEIRKSLQKTMEIFSQLRSVDCKGSNLGWKHIQTGLLISTQSFLELSSELLQEGYNFVLSSRVTQDSLESYFSLIRSHSGRQCTVTTSTRAAISLTASTQFTHKWKKDWIRPENQPFALAQKLKAKSIKTLNRFTLHRTIELPHSQYPLLVSTFARADGHPLSGIQCNASQSTSVAPPKSNYSSSFSNCGLVTVTIPNLSLPELQACYFLCGYLVRRVLFNKRKRMNAVCDVCISSLISAEPPLGLSAYTSLLSKGKLITPTEKVFTFFLMVYHQVQALFPQILNKSDLPQILCARLKYLSEQIPLPHCCNLPEMLLRKFVDFLVYLHLQRENEKFQSEIALSWQRAFTRQQPPWLLRRNLNRAGLSKPPRVKFSPSIF